ncbi:MAG TPA: hypothetical protein VM422_05610 [Amaricoccus sp.]|nr:hypothetical protein [Amaricoccus sp.]
MSRHANRSDAIALAEVRAADPIEFLEAFMAITGRTRRDLADALRSQSRASEILRRKRALSVGMIQRLHEAWGVPADALLAAPKLAA